jgi:hypothetical protein
MNRKWSTTALLITAIVGFAIGYFILQRRNLNQGLLKSSGTVKAVINLDTTHNNSCQQYAGQDFGHVFKDAFPRISQSGHQKIVWHGQINGGPPNAKVVVDFPAGQPPFINGHTFHENEEAGPVSSSTEYKDYPFLTVSVGGTPCNSFSDPGVHVDD